MKKLFQICLSIILIFFSTSFYSHANNNVTGKWTQGAYATPSVFKVKPLSMKLCESFDVTTGNCNGSNDVEFSPNVVTDNGRCDLAGVAPGAVACSATGANNIPKNVTFNFMRVVISRTMWLTGTVTPLDASGGTIDWNGGGDYDGNLLSCVTSSELTNTNGNSAPIGVAVSSGSQTPTEQAIYFLNGPGNDTFQGNANADSWSESRGNSLENPNATPDWNAACVSGDFSSFSNLYWANVAPLDNSGYSKTTSSSCEDYTYYNDYSTTWLNFDTNVEEESQQIWQGGIEASDEGFVMVYKLTEPFTRTLDRTPTLRMAFDVTNSIRAQFSQYVADEDPSPGTEFCTLDVGRPTVSITVTD
jgi:hypothetical protein